MQSRNDTDFVTVASIREATFVSQCCQVAMACLLVYDTMTTFDREIKYFWTTSKRSVGFIYFTNRYIGLFTAIFTTWSYTLSANENLCILTYWTHLIADWITLLLIDYILLMRVAALFMENRKIIRWLRALFILEAALELTNLLVINLRIRIGVHEMPEHISVCRYESSVRPLWGSLGWIVPIVYGLILMFMALYKTCSFWISSPNTRLSSSELIKVLIRDQAMYFLLVISCSVSNLIGSNLTTTNAFTTTFLFNVLGSPSLLCVLGSHLLFRLKEASERRPYRFSRAASDSISNSNEAEEGRARGGRVRRGSQTSFWAGETSEIRFAS